MESVIQWKIVQTFEYLVSSVHFSRLYRHISKEPYMSPNIINLMKNNNIELLQQRITIAKKVTKLKVKTQCFFEKLAALVKQVNEFTKCTKLVKISNIGQISSL